MDTKKKKEETGKSTQHKKKHQKGGQSTGQVGDYDFDTDLTEVDVIEIDNPDDITSDTK